MLQHIPVTLRLLPALASVSLGLVQEYEVKGGRVTVPVGCNGLEDWLLDNVDVQKLLPLLRQGASFLC